MNEQNKVADGKSQTASAPAKSAVTQTASEVKTVTAQDAVKTNPAPATAPPQDAPLIDIDAALGILATSKSRSTGGSKIRPGIGYTLVAEKMASLAGTSIPEQEQVIVKILLGALTKSKPVISEPELNKLVVAAYAAGKLKTKQDPWHIFRYYRTALKKRGVLQEVTLAA